MPVKAPRFEPLSLLGTAAPGSPELKAYLEQITNEAKVQLPEPAVKQFPDCTYHSYKSLGVSLCFVPETKGNDDTLKLDSIDIYNGHTRDGFKPFIGKTLPYGLQPSTQAHEIVSQLGEPDRKGGGGKTHLPCWIEYYFEDVNNKQKKGGIMIQLHGVDWDDREMGWSSLVLYR